MQIDSIGCFLIHKLDGWNILALAILSSLLATAAQATPLLQADAAYNQPGTGGLGATAVTGSPQSSATSVDILDFFTSGGVDFGVHTFGSIGAVTTFGNRVAGSVASGGPASYDVNGSFNLQLDNVGDSFSFDITSGEVSGNGSIGGLLIGDFVSAYVSFEITVDGTTAFFSDASAMVDGSGSSASFSGVDIGYGCSIGAGFGTCSIAGGAFTITGLDALTGTTSPHNLSYTLFAEAHGNLSSNYSDCYGGGGRGGATGQREEGGCGSIARSGDPLGVPEPSPSGLLILALLGLWVGRKH